MRLRLPAFASVGTKLPDKNRDLILCLLIWIITGLVFISAIVIRRSVGLFLRGGDDKKLLRGHHRALDDFHDAADGKQVKHIQWWRIFQWCAIKSEVNIVIFEMIVILENSVTEHTISNFQSAPQ